MYLKHFMNSGFAVSILSTARPLSCNTMLKKFFRQYLLVVFSEKKPQGMYLLATMADNTLIREKAFYNPPSLCLWIYHSAGLSSVFASAGKYGQ